MQLWNGIETSRPAHDHTPDLTMETLKNYIGGEFVECDRHLDSYNPATGEVHLRVPDSGKEEVQAAVEAAKKAFKKSGPDQSGCG